MITIRYFAGARAAAGCAEELLEPVGRDTGDSDTGDSDTGESDTGESDTVESVLRTVADRHGEKLATVLTACSVLLDEVAVRDRSMPVADGAVLDVLPPFAGG